MLAANNVGKIPFNHDVFDGAVRHIFERGGFNPQMLEDPEVQKLVQETFNTLNGAVSSAIKTETPPELTAALQNNTFIFSGFKTYHQLSEVGLSLTDANGHVKPFNTFRKDVETIDARYNSNYLYAEYNHAIHTSQMAVKWNDFMKDGDQYNLQYRTAGDDRVREAHAALDGVTLPPSDDFWKSYLPPNGWNCRCNVVQVLREDYKTSNSQSAIAAGDACTDEPKQRIFRYNAGREMTIFPKKHPYLPKGCGNCGGSLNLAYDPKREQCRVCRAVSEQARKEEAKRLYDRLSRDDKYMGVKWDSTTGALSAQHRGHNTECNNSEILNWNMTSYQLEVELQNLLYKNGHIAILCDEQKRKGSKTLPALDMQLDGVMMDIKTPKNKRRHYGSQIADKNGQLIKYNSRSDVTVDADTVCLYFHDSSYYHPGRITNGIKWARGKTSNFIIKNVVCVVRLDDETIEIYRHKA